jgi:hypothetical protein
MNFRRIEALADAHVRRDDLVSAARELESVTAKKHLSLTAPYWWMRCQLQLAEIYARTDRRDEAERIATALQRSLSESERGFPLTQRIRTLLAGR